MYERFHICDINIEDEQKSNNGRDISVYVDTQEMVNIEIGESMTIRTDVNGLTDLRDILHTAAVKLDDIHYHNNACDKMDELTGELQNAPVPSRDLSPTQTHDVWSAVDLEINDG